MMTRWLVASAFFFFLVALWHLAVQAHLWSPLCFHRP